MAITAKHWEKQTQVGPEWAQVEDMKATQVEVDGNPERTKKEGEKTHTLGVMKDRKHAIQLHFII